MSDCVFCRIAAGSLPATKVYEDASKLAFMDIAPIQPGHTLLIPKRHFERLTDLPEDVAADLTRFLPKLARAVAAATAADGFNVMQTNGACAGQSVFHVHFHVIPRHDGDGYRFHWQPTPYRPGQMEQWQKGIVEKLNEA